MLSTLQIWTHTFYIVYWIALGFMFDWHEIDWFLKIVKLLFIFSSDENTNILTLPNLTYSYRIYCNFCGVNLIVLVKRFEVSIIMINHVFFICMFDIYKVETFRWMFFTNNINSIYQPFDEK